MTTSLSRALKSAFVIVAATTPLAACAEDVVSGPRPAATQPQSAVLPASTIELAQAVATMQRVTARYQNINAAFDDEFVLLHECENRPGEGPVGAVYVQFDRLMDGVIDPAAPDALIYESGKSGPPTLVGVEFALPYPMSPTAPTFLGNTFQTEDEFGVWALHAWVWMQNPDGMFAQTNPRISCGTEE